MSSNTKNLEEVLSTLVLIDYVERLESRPVLQRTKTSQEQDKIEARLQKVFTEILDGLRKKALDKKSHYITLTALDIAEIKRELRVSVEDAYFAGKEYAVNSHGKRIPTTSKDLTAIENIVNEYYGRLVQLIHRAEIEYKEFGFDLLASYITSLITNAISRALNFGTLNNAYPPSPAFPSTPDSILPPSQKIQVEFVTRRDSKVCPICEPLDGTQYDIDDDSKPQIPDDTHPNCRCRYLIIRDGELSVG